MPQRALDRLREGVHHAPMKKLLIIAAALAASALAQPLGAALKPGVRAPDFSAAGALGGKPFAFRLSEALKKGPVVLYFYPKAFTSGCTLEAHAFAESMDKFNAAGATVIGMSADDLPTLTRFSTSECRSKFAVAAATPAVISAYDVALKAVGVPLGISNRTSYLIAPDGKIRHVYSNLDWKEHVKETLAAVQAMKAAR